jgi:hypothetical protein
MLLPDHCLYVMALQSQSSLTEAQSELVADLDDVAEHVAWEFDASEYEGIGTCGFAHVSGISGNGSFVRRVKSLAESDHSMVRESRQPHRDHDYVIEVGNLELSVRKDSYRGGYRLNITNVRDFRPGPAHQRIDVRERLHSLVLGRLRENGYLGDARVRSRMD